MIRPKPCPYGWIGSVSPALVGPAGEAGVVGRRSGVTDPFPLGFRLVGREFAYACTYGRLGHPLRLVVLRGAEEDFVDERGRVDDPVGGLDRLLCHSHITDCLVAEKP